LTKNLFCSNIKSVKGEILLHRKLFLVSSVLFILLISSYAVSADTSSAIWTRTYGGERIDSAESVIQTSDGGYAIVGASLSFSNGGYDCWLVKTDPFGNVKWHRHYGGSSADYASSVVETPDGGYVIAGHTFSFGVGVCDFLLVKTDALGNAEWSRTYGGPEIDVAHHVIATSDGGYAIIGYNGTAGANSADFLLIKTDEFGNMEWNKTYGGWNLDIIDSIITTPDGGYAMVGNTDSSIDGDYDVWLIKIDEFGNVELEQKYGRTPFQSFSNFLRPCSLVRTSDGGYAISANTNSTTNGFDFWLIKTDEFGVMEWNQTYGGTDDEQVLSLIQSSDEGYLMAGYTLSYYSGEPELDFFVVKTEGDIIDYELNHYFGFDTFTIWVSTNSSIENFHFDIFQASINFNVTGPTGTTGFCRITIPDNLLGGVFPLYLDGTLLVEGVDYTRTYNGTHNIFDITYTHSAHMIEIFGTNVIPEISSCLLPSLLLAATLVIVIIKKKPFRTIHRIA
jgi:hypothetical protein